MGILARRVRTRQPLGSARIDWSNPLTKGLFLALSPAHGADIVSGRLLIPIFGPILLGTQSGRGARTNATDNYYRFEFPATSFSAFTIAWLGGPSTTPALDARAFALGSSTSNNPLAMINVSASTSTKMRTFWRDDAGNWPSSIPDTTNDAFTVGVHRMLALSVKSTSGTNVGSSRTYINGAPDATSAVFTGSGLTLNRAGIGALVRASAGSFFGGDTTLGLFWGRQLTEQEQISLAQNPWQLFLPEQIWVPVSAAGGGGDVSLALTGQGGSFSQGVFTLQRETPVAGQSATFSAGLLDASLTIPLTGVSGAFAPGSVVPSVAVALIGLSATAAQGSPAASITLALTGQAGTFATGTVTASTGDGATLVGQGGTFSQGTPGVSITVALTGIAATLATGIVSAASGSATITLKAGSWLRYKKLI